MYLHAFQLLNLLQPLEVRKYDIREQLRPYISQQK